MSLVLLFRYSCIYCQRDCPAQFYNHMMKQAGHPPICPCQYNLYGDNPKPWSEWAKVRLPVPTRAHQSK